MSAALDTPQTHHIIPTNNKFSTFPVENWLIGWWRDSLHVKLFAMDTWYYPCFLLDFSDLYVGIVSIQTEYYQCRVYLLIRSLNIVAHFGVEICFIDGEDIIQNMQKLPDDVWSSLSNLKKGQFQGANLIRFFNK